MYSELRRERGLGPRGRLPPGNEDLLWLPRSAVVVAIASLDAYIHAVLYDRIPRVLRRNPIPEKLCEAMANIVTIKDAKTFRRAFPLISCKHIRDRLTNQLKTETLAFQPFQTPDKIIFAYALIGYANVFLITLESKLDLVLYDRIPRVLRRNPIPEKLCEAMANIVTIKDAKTFRRAFPLISRPLSPPWSKHIRDRLTNQLKTETLAFQPFQTPDSDISRSSSIVSIVASTCLTSSRDLSTWRSGRRRCPNGYSSYA